MYAYIYIYIYTQCMHIYIYTYIIICIGATYITPEIDTSEAIVEFQRHFPTDFHFSAVLIYIYIYIYVYIYIYIFKRVVIFPVDFYWNLRRTFSGILQWNPHVLICSRAAKKIRASRTPRLPGSMNLTVLTSKVGFSQTELLGNVTFVISGV